MTDLGEFCKRKAIGRLGIKPHLQLDRNDGKKKETNLNGKNLEMVKDVNAGDS